MKNKSKEEKQIDLAIEKARREERRQSRFYISSFDYGKGFRAGIEYQKMVIAKENEKPPTFLYYGPFKKDDQKKEYPEKVFARVTRSIISVKEVIKPCEKCFDTGEIYYEDYFPPMKICECHY